MSRITICSVAVLVLLAALMHNDLQTARAQIEPHWNYWMSAFADAESSRLTTKQFIDVHKDLGTLKDGPLGKAQLVQHIQLSSILCKQYRFNVTYSSSGDDGANLRSVSGNGVGWICPL